MMFFIYFILTALLLGSILAVVALSSIAPPILAWLILIVGISAIVATALTIGEEW